MGKVSGGNFYAGTGKSPHIISFATSKRLLVPNFKITNLLLSCHLILELFKLVELGVPQDCFGSLTHALYGEPRCLTLGSGFHFRSQESLIQ